MIVHLFNVYSLCKCMMYEGNKSVVVLVGACWSLGNLSQYAMFSLSA